MQELIENNRIITINSGPEAIFLKRNSNNQKIIGI